MTTFQKLVLLLVAAGILLGAAIVKAAQSRVAPVTEVADAHGPRDAGKRRSGVGCMGPRCRGNMPKSVTGRPHKTHRRAAVA
jgi:hypothetical protein